MTAQEPNERLSKFSSFYKQYSQHAKVRDSFFCAHSNAARTIQSLLMQLLIRPLQSARNCTCEHFLVLDNVAKAGALA